MAMIVLDRDVQREIIRDRQARRIDRYDEVWDGIYIMSPIADIEHQVLVQGLAMTFGGALGHIPGVLVLPGCNVSDRPDKWEKNYRVPDSVVFLPGNPAKNKGSHFLGGPDFAVEIISRHDRSRKKLDFYAKVGVRNLLLIDRKPWSLELFGLSDGVLKLLGKAGVDSPQPLMSTVLPLSFRMVTGPNRPTIEVTQTADARRWLI